MRLDPAPGSMDTRSRQKPASTVRAPHRINFMLALGPHQRIDGGAPRRPNSALARRAPPASRQRRQRLHRSAGAGRRLGGGPGNDRSMAALVAISSRAVAATIGSSTARATRRSDPDGEKMRSWWPMATAVTECCARPAPMTGSKPILATISAGCRRGPSSAGSQHRLTGSPSPRRQTSGHRQRHDADPYTAPPDNPDAADFHRLVPARTLNGLWHYDNVPAYRCPMTSEDLGHRYLVNKRYEPSYDGARRIEIVRSGASMSSSPTSRSSPPQRD